MPQSTRPRFAPWAAVLRGAAIVAVALAIAGASRAQSAGDDRPLPQPDWVTWVDPTYGFAVELPPGHRLARSTTEWYVHGMLDEEEPLVPDVSISFREGRDARELLERYEDDATVEEVAFGPGTRGLKVVSARRAPDGTPYLIDTYLVEAPNGAGTFRILRYEGFAWAPFEAVARSFRFVRETGDPLP
ncbi:MAG: hypothetical protein GVY27_09335 [Deinococcus-Thermus bacterium]|jgi:hypothetical protein|nr:hypothetical protein [Deinococcota bacterium]